MSKKFKIVLLCLFLIILSGCSLQQNIPEKVLKKYLDFRCNAKPQLASTSVPPFAECVFDESNIKIYDGIYDSFYFTEEELKTYTRQGFLYSFLIPLASYEILSIEEVSPEDTVIVVRENNYKSDAFYNEIFGKNPDSLYKLEISEKEQYDIERDLIKKAVDNFERNYANALKVPLVEDEYTYTIRKIEGEYKIIHNLTKSAKAEKEKQERIEAAQKYISSIKVIDTSVSKALDYVFIKGVVKNNGDSNINDMLNVNIEILDSNDKPIASGISPIAPDLKANFTDEFIVTFDVSETIGWSGNYRIRVSEIFTDISTDWVYATR